LRMADSAVGMSKNSMKPNPRGLPVSRSVTILRSSGSPRTRQFNEAGRAPAAPPPAVNARLQTPQPRSPDVLDWPHLAEVVDDILVRQVVAQIAHCAWSRRRQCGVRGGRRRRHRGRQWRELKAHTRTAGRRSVLTL
jgi:hypothetical protein